MKIWLKGGIIGGIISLILIILQNIPILIYVWALNIWIIFFFAYILSPFISLFGYNLFFNLGELGPPTFLGYMTIFLEFFLFGAFIGWIVGKVKKNKKKDI